MTSSPATTESPHDAEYDPVFLNARREAIIIFSVWVVALLWAVPYCYFNGYGQAVAGGEVSTVLGIPSWVFWGIGFPWLVADVFTTWFCFFYMKDDDLGEAHEDLDLQEEIAEMHAGEASQEGV